MEKSSRRDFLKQSGLAAASLILGVPPLSNGRTFIRDDACSGYDKDFFNRVRSELDKIIKDANRMYRDNHRGILRGKLKDMIPGESRILQKGSKEGDKYLVVVLNEKKSDLSKRVIVYEDVLHFPTAEEAAQAVIDYDKQDKIAAYAEML